MVIASDLNSNQIIENIDNKIEFWREWTYLGLRDTVRYPGALTAGDIFGTCMHVSPNVTARITIVALAVDNDGEGLDQDSILKFRLQYTYSDNTKNETDIFTMDVSNYTDLIITDNSGITHNYSIFEKFYLKNINNYSDIRLLNVGVYQTGGIISGNEFSLVVGYKQDY